MLKMSYFLSKIMRRVKFTNLKIISSLSTHCLHRIQQINK